jgi:dTDP-4-dehydrorhamnose reductase
MSIRSRGDDRPVILVTGAAGQLGFELTRTLAPHGVVRALDRRDLDVRDAAMIRKCVAALRPSLIVNAAAYTAVDAAEKDVATCRAVNAMAPGVLASEAARVGAAIVHYSTDYVFDGRKLAPYVESDSANPLNVYGLTKLEGERAVAAGGAPYIIIRTGWLFGRRGKNFVTTMLRLFHEREEVSVVNDQHGAPTWSHMLASATASLVAAAQASSSSAAEFLREFGGLYHLASAGETTWHGVAMAVRELDPHRESQRCRIVHAVPTTAYPTAARRPARSVLDSSRLRALCGLSLPHWRDELARCLADAS